MEEISLTINGKHINCVPGTSVLNAAEGNGIKIPTLCHHPHLDPAGACRLCLVEDEKSGRIMASCVTPVSPNMAIQTESPSIKKHRTNIIRLMMANHPESCIVCNQGNRCELRQIAAQLGVGQIGLYPMPHYTGFEAANPFIIRDLSKCILCGKCIRADHELVVVGAIDYNLRGFRSRPTAAHEMPLEKSNCTFCGTCVSMCPTGALVAKNTQYVGAPQKERTTVCGFCGVGCSLVMGSVDGHMVEVNPSHEDGTVNQSTLCVRGHFAHDFLNVSQRLTTPLIRKEGTLSPATWEEALGFVAERLTSIKKKNGPQSIGFLGSSKCTIEENYLFQKMARVIFETNNVDNGSYVSGYPALKLINEKLDGGGRKTPLAGLEQAEVIFIIGANPNQSVPVVSYYLKRASRTKGIPMVVADPRKTGLVPFSTLWLPLTPQSDYELISGLASILYEKKAYDADFIGRFTEGFDLFSEALSAIDIERVSRVTGLDVEIMEKAADLLAGKKIAFVVGHGVFQQRFGAQAMEAILNLALMTGSLGGDGKGLYFVARENNQMGAWDMGAVPDALPGRQSLSHGTKRKEFERAWEIKISPDQGLNLVRMIEEAGKGNLKALYIMGENPIRSLPQADHVGKSLKNLDFLVVQDILENETTHLANVVLPGAAFSEKAGIFTNLEGRIQSFEPVLPPPGEAKSDLEILDLFAAKLGYPKTRRRYPDLHYTPQRIREEISQQVPMYSEIKENVGESWIKEASQLKLFNPDGDAGLIHFSPLTPMEHKTPDNDYPHMAVLGSLRYHLGSGTRTGYSERIRSFSIKGEVEISDQDATRFGMQEGDTVKISSPYGTITREVKVVRDLRPGIIFVPMAVRENDAGNLLDLRPLNGSDSHGFKGVRVRLEKIED